MTVGITSGYFDPGYFEIEYFTSPYFGIRDILSPAYVDRANFILSLNRISENALTLNRISQSNLVVNREINFEVER